MTFVTSAREDKRCHRCRVLSHASCSCPNLTCHFERALGGVRDGGGHAHRRVTPLLESPRMAQALGLFQLSSECRLFAEARRLLPPLAGGLGLEAPRVVGAAAELVADFAVFAVPRESTFHQGALLRVSAKLQEGRRKKKKSARGTVRGSSHGLLLSANLAALCYLCYIMTAFQGEAGRDPPQTGLRKVK